MNLNLNLKMMMMMTTTTMVVTCYSSTPFIIANNPKGASRVSFTDFLHIHPTSIHVHDLITRS